MLERASGSEGPVVYFVTYLRSVFGMAFLIPFTVVYCLLCIAAGLLGFRDQCTRLIRQWASAVIGTFGIRADVRSESNIPDRGGGIIVFNHQSLFDIPVLMTSTPKHIRFGAKIELFSIPFFGRAMRAVGTLPIARENRTEVLKIYREAEKQFAQDYVFCLAPEGTRQKEPQIGRFKKGPFVFAINAGVPVIPVVIRGAHEVLPKKSLLVNVGQWARTVTVDYLPPIATKGLASADLDSLVERVRNMMEAKYKEDT